MRTFEERQDLVISYSSRLESFCDNIHKNSRLLRRLFVACGTQRIWPILEAKFSAASSRALRQIQDRKVIQGADA